MTLGTGQANSTPALGLIVPGSRRQGPAGSEDCAAPLPPLPLRPEVDLQLPARRLVAGPRRVCVSLRGRACAVGGGQGTRRSPCECVGERAAGGRRREGAREQATRAAPAAAAAAAVGPAASSPPLRRVALPRGGGSRRRLLPLPMKQLPPQPPPKMGDFYDPEHPTPE